MKKFIFLSIALAFIAGLGFTSCKDGSKSIDDYIQEYCEYYASCENMDDNQDFIDDCLIQTGEYFEDVQEGECESEIKDVLICALDLDCLGVTDFDDLCEDEMILYWDCGDIVK